MLPAYYILLPGGGEKKKKAPCPADIISETEENALKNNAYKVQILLQYKDNTYLAGYLELINTQGRCQFPPISQFYLSFSGL